MSRAITVWLVGFMLIVMLYVAGPALYFNRATPLILGMPPLYFWFVLAPIASMVILIAVFLFDHARGGVGSDVREDG